MNPDKYLPGNRLWLSAITGALGCAMLHAAPVTPQQAMAEAIAYRQSHSSHFRLPAPNVSPALAYTATGTEGNCFYVFNTPGAGFTIVSADDRLPVVLGFSENGQFDYDNIPPAMRWWLSEYEKEITTFLMTEPDSSTTATPRYASVNPGEREPIEPLLKTKWDQTAPYNDLCPLDPQTGRRSVTGCVATAMAQVMKHHQWPINPHGSNAGYMFTGTTLQWDEMLDVYEDYNYTSTQAEAVATLMRQCGAAVNMMYSSNASGAYSSDVPNALATYFDYNRSMQIHWRDYYTQSQWIEIVYNELAANRPLYYSGQSNYGGHAFVCDGYMGNNFFHFNWGWSGYQDGYFLLNALNPATGGAGSSGGGYNAMQSIITDLRPSQGETKRQTTLLSTGSFTYRNGNKWQIADAPDQQNMIYNPLPYVWQFNVGLKVTSFDDPDKVTYVKDNTQMSVNPYYGFDSFTLAVPSLPNGRYKVAPAMFVDNEWVDIQVPAGLQRFVTLTVQDGKQTFSNDGPESSAKAVVYAGLPEHVSTLYCNAPMAYRLTLSNVSSGEYSDNVLVSLYHDEDPFAPIEQMAIHANIPPYSSVDLIFSGVPTLEPGPHSMYVTNSKYVDMCEPVALNLVASDFTVSAEKNIVISEVTPAFVNIDTPVSFSFRIENTSDILASLPQVKVRLLNTDMSEAKAFNFETATDIPAKESVIVNLEPTDLGLGAGDYMVILADAAGKSLSLPYPLKLSGPVLTSGEAVFTVTDAKNRTARLTAVTPEENTIRITIPESVEGYRITELKSDVFTYNDKLTAIDLPSGISAIEPASFYLTSSLQDLTLRASTPPALYDNAFDETAYGRVWISGPDGRTNLYHADVTWGQFEMSSWTITTDADITISSGLLIDPQSGTWYSPYYVGTAERLAFEVSAPDDRSVRATYTIGDKTSTTDFWRSIILPVPGLTHATVHLSTIDSSATPEITAESHTADFYTPTGVLVLRNSTPEQAQRQLPAGIYISSGRKIVIK